MKKITICAFFDALSWQVYKRYGFMAHRTQDARALDSVFGFSSAADPSILTGAHPEHHQHWSSFYYDPQNSPFKPLRLLAYLPGAIVDRWRVRHQLSKLIAWQKKYTGYFEMYSVPFGALPYFDYLEKKDYFVPGGILRGTTVFDQFHAAGLPYHCSNWRHSEAKCREALSEEIKKGEIQFAYLYQPKLDALMHAVGPDHPKVAAKLKEYEASLEALLQLAEEHYDEVAFYAFSDHGMAAVKETVNLINPIEQAIKTAGLRYGRDYVAMYDSTMARFWFPDGGQQARAREVVSQALATVEHSGQGQWVSEEQMKKWGCDFGHTRFGEMIFLMRPGALIVPSYMGRKAIAGMHGYDPQHKDSQAFLISNRKIPDHVRCITDLRSIMVKETLHEQPVELAR